MGNQLTSSRRTKRLTRAKSMVSKRRSKSTIELTPPSRRSLEQKHCKKTNRKKIGGDTCDSDKSVNTKIDQPTTRKNILLLGTFSVGKTTLVKQLQILKEDHEHCLNEKLNENLNEKLSDHDDNMNVDMNYMLVDENWIFSARKLCIDILVRLVRLCCGELCQRNVPFADYLMHSLNPYDISFMSWSASSSNSTSSNVRSENNVGCNGSSENESFGDKILALWRDEAVQRVLNERAHKARVIYEQAVHLFSIFDKIRNDGDNHSVVITEKDHLMVSLPTIGVVKHEVDLAKGMVVPLLDVGAAKRSRWNEFYSEAMYVVFVVSLASYNMEHSSELNCIEESIQAFAELLSNETLKHVPILLVFNQVDLLCRRMEQFNDMQDYFPQYEEYYNDGSSGPNVEEAKYFLKQQLLNVITRKSTVHESKVSHIELVAIDKTSVNALVKVMGNDLEDLRNNKSLDETSIVSW